MGSRIITTLYLSIKNEFSQKGSFHLWAVVPLCDSMRMGFCGPYHPCMDSLKGYGVGKSNGAGQPRLDSAHPTLVQAWICNPGSFNISASLD